MEEDLYFKIILTAISVIQLLQVVMLHLIANGQRDMWTVIHSLDKSVYRMTKTTSRDTSL